MTKKYWLVALLALGIAGCSDDDKKSDGNHNQPEATCGNHQLDENEVCDGEADLACTRFDSSKTWKEGGLAKCSADCKSIEKGTCELVTPECSDDDTCAAKDPQKPKCDQGVCIANPNAKECENSDACIAKDPNKPICKLPEGVCVAEEKECENSDACIAKDPNKPVCKLPEGVCVADEKECENSDACIAKDPNKPVCKLPEGVCVADEKECQDNDACIAKYGDEKPVCNKDGVCEAETGEVCETPEKEMWCQLMGPIKVEFDTEHTSVDLSAYVYIKNITDASEANDGRLQAQLVYSEDINDKDLDRWPHVDASSMDAFEDCALDGYKATLTTSQLALVNSNKAYYTFRFRENTGDDSNPWIYCRYNKDDVDATNKALDLIGRKPDGSVDAVAFDVGLATNLGDLNQIIARFDFEKGDPAAAITATYSADLGSGTIQGVKTQCNAKNNGGCFTKGADKAWNIKNWKTAKTDALKDGAHILITDLDTTGATAINLDLDISRSSDDKSSMTKYSATDMVVLFSTDGETFTESSEFSLNPEDADAPKTDVFYHHTLELKSEVNNQSSLTLKLVPYGGNNFIRIDNVEITKNNN